MAPAALTVGQKAALIAAIAIAILAAAVLATAWLTSVRIALVLWSGALLLLVAVAWLRPLHVDRLAAAPDPVSSYAAAVARFEADAAAAPQPLNPLCHPELLTHGTRTSGWSCCCTASRAARAPSSTSRRCSTPAATPSSRCACPRTATPTAPLTRSAG